MTTWVHAIELPTCPSCGQEVTALEVSLNFEETQRHALRVRCPRCATTFAYVLVTLVEVPPGGDTLN